MNYQELTDKLTDLYNQIEKNEVSVVKAGALVKTAATINSIQRAKLIATIRTAKENKVKFYEDKYSGYEGRTNL